MEKHTKIALAILAGLLVLGICVCVGGWIALRGAGRVIEEQMILDDPDEAEALARRIIDYELPAGYREQAAINMGIMKMVIIAVGEEGDTFDTDRPVIMILEAPENTTMDEEELLLQFQESMESSMEGESLELELVGESTTTIRGQEVPLLTYEGTNDQGDEMRQIVSGLFEGKEGAVVVMVVGKESGWDEEEIDAFIESIR
jgi:hypothetical protein